MASLLFKLAAKRALEDTSKRNTNKEDPLYDYEEIQIVKGGKTKTKRKRVGKKRIPEGLSPHDAEVLKQVRRRAYHLDMSLFNLCGIRFGWGSLIGFIPAVGDVLDMLLALILVRKCSKIEGGLPMMLQTRMLFNVMLDFVIGIIPFVGDAADAAFRANTRNAWLLESYLRKKAELGERGIEAAHEAGMGQNTSSGRPIIHGPPHNQTGPPSSR